MTQLLGTIKDSGKFVLSGKLVITLDAPIADQSTNPDSYLLTEPHEYIITAGVVNIDLLPTEEKQITYRFQFFKLISVGLYAAAKPDFHAMIPDAVDYQWAQLEQTGITTAQLDTSAIKVGREILTNDSLKTLVTGALGFFRQASTPTALSNYNFWIKTPEVTFWQWDATLLKWLSSPISKDIEIVGFQTAGTNKILTSFKQLMDYDSILLDRIKIRYSVLTPCDAVNRYQLRPGRRLVNAASLTYDGTTELTNSVSVGSQGVRLWNPAATISLSTSEFLGLEIIKTGSPGVLNASICFTYRFIQP